MTENRLALYLDGVRTGLLQQSPQGQLSFEYDDAYRTDSTTTPLSISIPKATRRHPNKPVRAFISGLLPDSEAALQRLGRKYGVSPNNPFALLRHIGRDAAGAVQILPEEIASADAANRQGDIEWLTEPALDETLAELARSPETWDPGRNAGRWSLAGAQSKIALFRSEDGRWGVPRDSTPTTHILKPSMPNYQGHHLNEHLSLRAAQLCGLAAAETELLASDRYEVLISQRYDRVREAGRWVRLHQEDMCQALAVPPVKKYQEDGGPGIQQIGALLARNSLSRSRAENLRRMFDYVVFNAGIGATDAHAKNYSVLLGPRDIRLAPLYDVASILPYDQGRGLKSAMKIGRTWSMTAVTDDDWIITGGRLGISAEESVSRAKLLMERIPSAFRQAAGEALIPEALRQRAHWIADLVTAHLRNQRDQWGNLKVPSSPGSS
ncbi:type II toxin-antitoxin system HipA family toxin [Kribbella solani]|uniref:type II toxin-antitoxin system HipA family toxin n=1 Tax=Kribbella solani TaxID=236067 RepID=UPI0029BCCB59|nr:type II toxin-antitoxin system HipA family toxin [Kribbella solani]MDX3003539.1 type II toxin-antitoxin system HipA family toxin [Kribbella solani]